MTTLREAAERALKSLEDAIKVWTEEMEFRSCVDVADSWNESAAALREALAQPAAEPVAWIFTWYEIAKDRHVRRIIDCEEKPKIPGYDLIPLYTAPPQRKPLTEEQVKPILDQWKIMYGGYTLDLIRAIERAHGIGSEE